MSVGESAIVALVGLPLMAAVAAFVRPTHACSLMLACGVGSLAAVWAMLRHVTAHGVWHHEPGGWGAPLGIVWQVDGASATMLALTSAVAAAAGLHRVVENGMAARQDRLFWPLWFFLWGGLNALFLSRDLFNLYVALELVALAAVALIAQAGGRALAAAWRYFVVTLLGSSVFLLGVGLLYGQYGTLDMGLLAAALTEGPAAALGAVFVSVGLLLKAAVFPLHFWLPMAHGRAPVAVSAMLSGVVVAAAFWLLLRLWLEPFAPLLGPLPASVLGAFGAAAMLWGGLQALLQRQLKMVIAYSTVSQLGYVLLVFPLLAAGAGAAVGHAAWLFLLAHGLAKAALFLAAGSIVGYRGHGRLTHGAPPGVGVGWAWSAAALAAASLVGVPPSGGFAAKWWMIQAAFGVEAWLWAGIMLAGSALTAAYLVRMFEPAVVRPVTGEGARAQPPALGLAAFVLALLAFGLGLALPALEAVFAVGEGGL